MIRFNCKDYTNCIGDYVKDLEKAYSDEKVKADVYEKKYKMILGLFKMLSDDMKEL